MLYNRLTTTGSIDKASARPENLEQACLYGCPVTRSSWETRMRTQVLCTSFLQIHWLCCPIDHVIKFLGAESDAQEAVFSLGSRAHLCDVQGKPVTPNTVDISSCKGHGGWLV